MDVQEQKYIAAEVLVKIKKYIDSEAIIAGGAPRNWEYGMLANDVDLYLRSNCINTSSRFMTQLKHCLGIDEIKTYQIVDVGDYTFGLNLKIVKLVGVVYKGVNVQFIVMDPNGSYTNYKKQIVDHMDIGLNRIYCDWYRMQDVYLVNKTKEYSKDFENNTLTLYTDCMTPSQLKHCMEYHLPKMQKYYPDYKLVINK